MKKLFMIFILALSIVGCSEFRSVEEIKTKYPDSKIYMIDQDEYIVTTERGVRYIETDFNVITIDRYLRECVGFKY